MTKIQKVNSHISEFIDEEESMMNSIIDFPTETPTNEVMMGELLDPNMRDKYSRDELIEHLDQYDALVKQLEFLR